MKGEGEENGIISIKKIALKSPEKEDYFEFPLSLHFAEIIPGNF